MSIADLWRRPGLLVAVAFATCSLLLAPGLVDADSRTQAGAITDLTFDADIQLVRPDGSFIPLDEREWTAVVTWRSTVTGASFEVLGRALRNGPLVPRGTVTGTGPEFRFQENTGFFELPLCYVVRLGPTDMEACREELPSSGVGDTPLPHGTPWPAPTGLRTTNAYEGSPPTTLVRISWDVLPGFIGVFEVQRAETITQKYRPMETEFSTVAVLPASASVDGRITFSDSVSFEVASQRPACYRVRAVIAGETGPYTTEPACSVLPPGADSVLTPGAPHTGTSNATGPGEPSRGTLVVALLATAAVILGALLGIHARWRG